MVSHGRRASDRPCGIGSYGSIPTLPSPPATAAKSSSLDTKVKSRSRHRNSSFVFIRPPHYRRVLFRSAFLALRRLDYCRVTEHHLFPAACYWPVVSSNGMLLYLRPKCGTGTLECSLRSLELTACVWRRSRRASRRNERRHPIGGTSECMSRRSLITAINMHHSRPAGSAVDKILARGLLSKNSGFPHFRHHLKHYWEKSEGPGLRLFS